MVSLLEFIKETTLAMIEANVNTENLEFRFDSSSDRYYCKISRNPDKYGGWENFGFCLNDVRRRDTSHEEMSAMVREQIYSFIKNGFLTMGGK